MRKRRLVKKRSCPLCHGYKTGHAVRWTPRELERLTRWEQERDHWLRGAHDEDGEDEDEHDEHDEHDEDANSALSPAAPSAPPAL